ncbi:unnamed protein product, partial [Pylaiella littoralis]
AEAGGREWWKLAAAGSHWEPDRRPVSGIATMVGGAVVSHKSSTQPIVSNSSAESEYIAAGEGVREALFERNVLSFIAP